MSAVIHAVEEGAVVYHDGFVIQGISFVPDEDLAAKFDHILIPVDDAVKFVQGDMNYRQWFVWFDSSGPVLYHDTVTKVSLNRINDEYERIPPPAGKAGLIVRIYRDTPKLVFQIAPGVEFQSKLTYMTFVFTKANDPSAVMHVLDVSLTELLKDGLLTIPFPNYPNIKMDVYTRKVFPFHHVEYSGSDDDLTLKLPDGHFVDMMRFSRSPIEQGLQAALRRSLGTMELSLVGDSVEKYDRHMDHMRLLFSMPDDPTLLLYATTISVAKLQDGISIKLPTILDQPFDLWSPLLYRHANIVEN